MPPQWTPRAPRLEYTVADTMRDLSTLVLQAVSGERAAKKEREFRSEEAEKDRRHAASLLYEEAKLNEFAEVNKALNAAQEEAMKTGTLGISLDQLSDEQKTLARSKYQEGEVEQQDKTIKAKRQQRIQILTDLSSFTQGETMASEIDLDDSGSVDTDEMDLWMATQDAPPGEAFTLGVNKYRYDPMKRQELLALEQVTEAKKIDLKWLDKFKQQEYDALLLAYDKDEIEWDILEQNLADLQTESQMNKMLYSNLPEKIQEEMKQLRLANQLKGVEINIADQLKETVIKTGKETFAQLVTQGAILKQNKNLAIKKVAHAGIVNRQLNQAISIQGWEFDEAQIKMFRDNSEAMGLASAEAQSNLGDILMNSININSYSKGMFGISRDMKSLNYFHTMGKLKPDEFEGHISDVMSNKRYQRIGTDLRQMIVLLQQGSIDALEKPGVSPRHNFLVKVGEVYEDYYRTVAESHMIDGKIVPGIKAQFKDPDTETNTTIKAWVDRRVEIKKDEWKKRNKIVYPDAIDRFKETLIRDAVLKGYVTDSDAERYFIYEEWDDTGIFDDISTLEMVMNSLGLEDQHLQLNDLITSRVLSAAAGSVTRPSLFDAESIIEPINPNVDAALHRLLSLPSPIPE